MQTLKPLEIGVMFWGGRDPVETLREVKSLGVRCGQIGIPGDMDLGPEARKAWKSALAAEQFTLVTVFAGYNGESYADIPTVQQTVGFIPPASRAEREARTVECIRFGGALSVPSFANHVGFVPHDTGDPDYLAVRDMVRRVCDEAAAYHQTYALETGQEPAATLLQFFQDVDRPNLRINFDPANLILYGSGDPIEALAVLAKHVVSVHAKDGAWPPTDVAGALGTEMPLGQGAVGMERFIAKLKEIGYTNPL
ncbi:MAG: sugar phosphate isomerase/epimerase family protein, partial [Bryobacteraceae bacterium]